MFDEFKMNKLLMNQEDLEVFEAQKDNYQDYFRQSKLEQGGIYGN